MDNKNKHFPTDAHSPDKQLFGIPMVQLSESDSPEMIPWDKVECFLEVTDSERKTKALFFLHTGIDCWGNYLGETTDWNDFTSGFDSWIIPGYHWGDFMRPYWLPLVLGEEGFQKLLKEEGVIDADVTADLILDGLMDHLRPDYYWTSTNMLALFLMTYGRLKYPYNLTNEYRDYYEIYMRGFIEQKGLIPEFRKITNDPKEISELINFCGDLYPDKESFRDTFIHDWNYREYIEIELDTFVMISDLILSIENIDRFLDEAHADNKIDLKLFLLDYKNKHFPVSTKVEFPTEAGENQPTGVNGKIKSSKQLFQSDPEIIVPEGYTYINEFAFRYHRGVKKIILPDSICEIDEWAFAHCEELEEINLVFQITEIKPGTFINCKSLKKIIIPGNIKSIGEQAFSSCSSLEDVDLQEGLESINDKAFSNCPNLKQIKLPASMKEISLNAFDYSGITEFDINCENPIFTVKDGALYKKETDQLIIYPPGRQSL